MPKKSKKTEEKVKKIKETEIEQVWVEDELFKDSIDHIFEECRHLATDFFRSLTPALRTRFEAHNEAFPDHRIFPVIAFDFQIHKKFDDEPLDEAFSFIDHTAGEVNFG